MIVFNCEIGVAGFFEMPPKAKPPIIDADLFYGVVGDCLTDFFKNHTTQCSCEQVILNLNDELNNCKSLIVAQTALINQLYNAVIDLKFDLHKSQGPFQQASPSFKSAREKRRSDMEVKTNTLSDSSLATDIAVYNNTNNLTAVRRQSFVNISQPSDTEKLQNANSPNLEICRPKEAGKNADITRQLQSTSIDASMITTNLPKSYALAASSSDFVATNQQKTSNSSNQHKTTVPSSITDVRSSKRFVSKNSSTLTGAKAKLVPLQKFCWTYVSNLSADQKVDDILAVLKELDQDASFEVEKPANLNRKPTSSAFIVKAPVHLLPTIRDPDFWPANTYVNKYYFPKKTTENFQQVAVEPTTT
jgi:hypothetical protein